VDGAVWISHLKAKPELQAVISLALPGQGDAGLYQVAGIKLPATRVLGSLLRGVPEAPLPIDAPADHRTFREIVYTGEDEVGYLYGSEYWTYTLPRRVGWRRALELTLSCRPIGTRAAREMGFLDDAFGVDTAAFEVELRERARRLARDPEFRVTLRKKHERRL